MAHHLSADDKTLGGQELDSQPERLQLLKQEKEDLVTQGAPKDRSQGADTLDQIPGLQEDVRATSPSHIEPSMQAQLPGGQHEGKAGQWRRPVQQLLHIACDAEPRCSRPSTHTRCCRCCCASPRHLRASRPLMWRYSSLLTCAAYAKSDHVGGWM